LGGGAGVRAGAEEAEFDVDSFSKRYPSLSGLEMVETEIPARGRVRDV
jgi:AP2-associated kinase